MKSLMSILVVLLFSQHEAANALAIIPGDIKMSERTDANDKPIYYLEIDGGIAYPIAEKMKELLAQMKPSQPLVVKLNSQGGSNEQGKAMIALIQEEIRKGRIVSTSVVNGDKCGSMCVPVYMQGKFRYAGEGTLFMFHGSTRPNFSNIPVESETEEVIRILIKAGISGDWIKARRAEGVFTLPGAYWISGRELFDVNANVITKILPRHEKEIPWTSPIDPSRGPR